MRAPGARLAAAIAAAQARDAAALAARRRAQIAPLARRPPDPSVPPPAVPIASGRPSAPAPKGGGKSALVEELVRLVEAAGLPPPRWAGSPGGELMPVPGRRFRLDLAWEAQRVYCEVDGGAWIAGRHSRGPGILSDCEKTSLLAGLGWRLVRVATAGGKVKPERPGGKIQAGAVAWIRAALSWGESPAA